SMLYGLEPVSKARHRLGPEHFSVSAHQAIFQAVCDMADAGKPIDLLTVCQHLEDAHELTQVGGRQYVSELCGLVPSPVAIDHYCGIVAEKWAARQLVLLGSELSQEARTSDEDEITELLQAHMARVESVRQFRGAGRNGTERFAFDSLLSFEAAKDP